MALQSDTLLGPYQIQKQIGAGGMGEVYLAKDTRLGRTVALKILPSNLAENEQLKQRLEREALAISNLSHPNICTLYDVGTHAGKFFLVMEFIEGETLAAHLAKRKLPGEDVLRYGIQIADALDKAHRKGIIHRDLKPGNIMISKSGVKLLDFGLAKFQSTTSATAPAAVSLLPTADDLTAEGSIVGTLQYMAPEQLEGKDADSRTDLFALGAILYEMATGKKAFTGISQASVIAAILSSEVSPVSVSEPMSPPQLDHVVQRCLAKNPEDRWQTATDVMHELQWIASSSKTFALPAPASIVRKSKWIAISLLSFVLLGIGLIAARAFFPRNVSESAQQFAFSIVIPDEAPVDLEHAQLALSPDARHLVFVSRDASGKTRLWLRDLGSLQVTALQGTQGAMSPFWSPDSQWIAFFAETKLKKLRISESQPQTLCAVGTEQGGGTWNRDGVILFSPLFEGPLYKISENGGPLEKVTALDVSRRETSHAWPQFLPDQRHFLFHSLGRDISDGVYIGTLDSPETRALIVSPGRPAIVARFAPPDYLLFAQGTDLMAQRFDIKRLELTGQPIRIAEGITRLPWSEALFSVEKDILAFRANVTRSKIQLVWFDRKGSELQRIGLPQSYEAVSLSPDNRRAAVGRWESSARRSIWLLDLRTGIETRFSFSTDDMMPVWSPDSQQLVFASARDTPPNLFLKNLSGEEKEERLFSSNFVNCPTSWSSDGRFILYFVRDKSFDIGAVDLKENRKQIPLIQTEFDEWNGQISADGKWIAYESNESGRNEVYVRPFLTSGRKWKVSSQGGRTPIWRSDGQELFYLDPENILMSVKVRAGDLFETEAPQPLFEAPVSQVWGVPYAVSSDGNRFLINTVAAKQPPNPPIHILVNWTQRLKK